MTLKKVLGRTFISLTGLPTIVTKIEVVHNNRPITYISSDVNDLEPLTPAHLLYGHRIVPLTDDSEIDDPNYGETTGAGLQTRVTQHTQELQHFQHCWTREYLTSLQELHRTTRHNEQDDDIPRA